MVSIKWLIPDLLGGSPMPSPDDLLIWNRSGVQCIMNLIAEYYGGEILKQEEETGFEVYHLPIMDMSVPHTLKEMDEALVWLKKQTQAKKKTIIHCLGGIGRTSTVLICFLLSRGETIEAAVAQVSHLGIFPQSNDQFSFLSQFYSYKKIFK